MRIWEGVLCRKCFQIALRNVKNASKMPKNFRLRRAYYPGSAGFPRTSRVLETVHVTLNVTLKQTLGKSLFHPDPGIAADFGLTKLLKRSLVTNLKQART